jgi:uncharacterized protein
MPKRHAGWDGGFLDYRPIIFYIIEVFSENTRKSMGLEGVGDSMEKAVEEIKIRISGLSNGLHEYHFSADPPAIGLESNFRLPVEVDATVDKTSRQIDVKVLIRTTGVFECDRCLDSFEQPCTAEYRMFYTYDRLDGATSPADEIVIINPDTVSIDLTDDVRQMILLSVPLKLLCRETCKGLCPRCGTNWNYAACDCKEERADPRFQGLKDLLKN